MNLIIAGGRHFNNYQLLKNSVDKLCQNHKITNIISGKAKGADSLGEKYAKERDINIIAKEADWNLFGKSAGYRRNVEMANIATHAIVFWDGKSKGSKHMIDIMKQQNKPVRVVMYE